MRRNVEKTIEQGAMLLYKDDAPDIYYPELVAITELNRNHPIQIIEAAISFGYALGYKAAKKEIKKARTATAN